MRDFPERLSIDFIKNAYESNELTPYELADEIINRASKYKNKNIFIVEPSKEFIYKYIDKLPQKSENTPLWGIPFAIKDNIDLADVPTTAACPDYAYKPSSPAFVVDRLISAGAIPVGKTNLDQFATGLVGTRSPYGEVRNAFDDEMISGGSSSGSAVAVALGIAAFSLGTDTAGSGRVPAMLNSLVGYKPSLGAWSTSGVVPACESIDTVTVFAGNLKDCRRVDSVARAYDENCPWSKHYDKKEPSLPEIIFLPKDEPEFFGDNAGIYREKWYKEISKVESLGVNVQKIDYQFFYDAAKILYDGAYVAERWEALGDFVESHPDSVFPVTKKILESGKTSEKTAARLFKDLHALQSYWHKAENILKDAVMIMPTAGGSFTRDEVREDPVATNSKMGLYTNHCNLLNLCAIAVPEDISDRSYPFGITIFGLSENTSLVEGVAGELE